MARIRSIHPCVCMSEDADSLSDGAERTMMRLLTHSDDEGRGQDRPDAIASILYPGLPEKDGPTIDGQMHELAKVGILTRYTVRGKRYYAFTNWSEYQSPQKPKKSKLPPPEDADDTPTPPVDPPPDTSTVQVNQARHTPTVDEDLPVSWGVEGSGGDREGNGDQNNRALRAIDIATPPTTADQDSTLAKTLYRWFADRGDNIAPHACRSDDYRRLLILTGQHHDIRDGPYKRIAERLCREYVAEVTGEELSDAAVRHMRRIIGQSGGEAALEALAQAVTQGAGLDGEWALDERALSKYAGAILSNQRKAAQ